MENVNNGLELLSGKLVVLFLTYALALEACVNFPAGTRVKVTDDPNPDLNGEYIWDGTKLVKTTNNTLEKAKDEAEKIVEDKIKDSLTPENILDIISGRITESDLDQSLRQRIDKIKSVEPIIDELKKEADLARKELDEKLFFLEVDYNNLKNYVTSLELEINIDFQGIKDQIEELRNQVQADLQEVLKDMADVQQRVQELKDQVDADFKVVQDRIDAIQSEVDQKWLEVDQIKTDLDKEIIDRIAAVKAETDARVEQVRLLNDGLTQERKERIEGDSELRVYVDNYKSSNDQALANVREEIKVAVDTSNATAEKVTALDARVKVAEDNSGKALENSAAAVSKATAAADLASATATRVDSLQAEVVKAVDDSGKALTNSATALTQSQAAVDKSNATANQVTILETKLNDKTTTYRQNTAPTKASHPNLTVGDIWINPSAKNAQKRWDGANWVDINDVRVGENATAITSLTTTVSQQGDKITAVANRVTSLETTIGDMATSEALEQLKTTVTQQGDKIDANAQSITALNTKVDGKADSKALQDLEVKVNKNGDDIRTNASSITSLNSNVNASMNAVNITADLDLDHDITVYLPNSKGEITKTESSDGTSGRILKFGNNSGDDTVWMHPNTFLPYDPDVMYKVRAKLRRTANSGTGKTYIGIACKNFDKSKYVTTTNTLVDNMGASAYLLSSATPPVGVWTEYEWYIKGRSTGSALLPPTYGTVENPVQLQRLAGYVSPMIIANYQGVSGELEVAYVVLEVAEAYKAISANANALTSLKTDVQKNADGIKAVGEAVTNVEASITNMDIGGQNLWSIWGKTIAQSSVVRIEWQEGQENDEWYKATMLGDVATYQHYFSGIMVDENYPIVVGEEYTVTFEMRASKALPIYQVLAYFGDIGTIQGVGQRTTTEWSTYTFTAKSRGTATNGSYQLFGFTLLKAAGWAANDWYEVRRLQLQKGNKATRYQKAQAGLIAGIRANSQAFNTLNATVKQQGDTITSQGQALTGLESKVNGIDGKVNGQATAINELKTTVIEQGDKISAQGQAITKVESKVDGLTSGGGNLLKNGNFASSPDFVYWNVWGTSSTRTLETINGKKWVRLVADNSTGFRGIAQPTSADSFKKATEYTVTFSAYSATPTGAVRILIHQAGGGSNDPQITPVAFPITNQNKRYSFTFTSANLDTKTAFNFMIGPQIGVAGDIYLTDIMFSEGNMPTAWGPSDVEVNNRINANASAITSLQTDVKKVGDDIKIQAEQITGVKATLSANDSDSLTLDYNTAEPTAWDSFYTTNLTGHFKTTTTGKIGPNVMRKDASTGVNFVDINKSKVPNTRPYKVSFWIRRSSDSTGSYMIFTRFVKVDGTTSNSAGGYVGTTITPAIPANGVWTKVEMIIDNTTSAATNPQLQFGIAMGHTGSAGWSEMQGFKVSQVLTGSDTDGTIASSEAVQSLKTTVDKQGETITAQGLAITGLQTKVDGKADVSVVNELKTTVKTQGDKIDAQGQAITGLQTKVDGKADLTALNELKTTVAQQGDKISANSQAITSVDTKVNLSGKAGANLLRNSNVVGAYTSPAYPHLTYNLTEDWITGQQYTLLWCAEHKRGTGDTNSSLAVYAGGGSNFLQGIANTNGKVVNKFTFIKNSATTMPRALQFYMMNRPTATDSVGTVYWAVLVKGDFITTDEWVPSAFEYVPEMTANASAITALQTDVKKNGDDIKVTAEQVTGVKATIGAIGNDSIVLDYEVKTPSAWLSHYGYDLTKCFTTTTSGKVSNTVFRKDTTTAPTNLNFNYNLSNLPNDRAYKVTFWVRRSSDSVGTYAIPIMLGRKGVWSSANYTTVVIPPAEIPADGNWYFISKIVNMTSSAATNDQIRVGIALGHTGTTGWSEMQAYKVQPVINNGDTDGTVASSEAVQNLKTTVDQQGNTITAQGQALTGLESKVNGKADASALNELKTTVIENSGKIDSQSKSITSLQSSMKSITEGITMSASIDIDPDDEWIYWTRNGEVARADEITALGGKVYRFGNNAGNDHVNARSRVKIPFDQNKTYRVRVRYRRNSGSGTVYCSVFGIAADGVSHVNGNNVITTDAGAANYFVINQSPTNGAWQEVVVFVKGRAAGAATGLWTMDSPRQIPANTAYLSLQFLCNYPSAAGVTDLDYMILEDADALKENDITAKATSALSTKVTAIEGVNTVQANQIASLRVDVDGKASSSALESLDAKVVQQGKDITATSQKVTGLESNLNDLATSGGGNLIWNGDFTDGLNNWGLNGSVSGFTLYDWTARGMKWGRYTSSDTTTTYKGFRQVVPIARGLKPNATYTLSFKTHGNAASVDKSISIIIHRQGTSSGTNQTGGGPFTTPSGIAQHSLTFNTDGITDLTYLNIIFYCGVGFAPDFFVTEIQLEEGKVATAYQKSTTEIQSGISANAQAVTQLKTDVKNQGDTISSQGQLITNINVRVNNMEKDNLLNPFKDAVGSGAIYEMVAIPMKQSVVLKTGDKFTVRGKLSFEHPNALTDTQGIGVYLDGSPRFLSIPLFKQGPDQVFEGTVTIDGTTNGRTVSNLKFFFLPSGTSVAATKLTVHWAELIKGDSILGGTASAVQSLNATVKQQGDKIESNSQSITSLNSSVNTLQGQMGQKVDASVLVNYYTKTQTDSAIAGSLTEFNSKLVIGTNNLVKNGDFSKDMASWNKWGTSSTNTIEVVSGAKRLKMVGTNNSTFRGVSQPIPAGSYRRNIDYVVSFTAFSLEATGKVRILFHQTGDGSNDPQAGTVINVTNVSGKYSFTFKSSNILGKTGFTLFIGPDINLAGTIFIQDVMFSEGNVTAGWTDSSAETQGLIEFNSTAIGKLETRATAIEGVNSTQATQIQGLQSDLKTTNDKVTAQGIAFNQLDTKVTQQGDKITAQGNSITQVESRIDNLKLDRVTVPDTRNDNQPPSWYITNYKSSVVTEFKNASVIGITGLGTYVTLETTVPFADLTGGPVQQKAKSGDELLVMSRYSVNATTWSPWKQYLKELDTATQNNALATSQLSTKVDQVDGKVTSTASALTQLDTKVGQNTASIQQHTQSIDGLMVKWSVKADVNGYVSGVAMNNDGKNADFIIRADTFAIAPPVSAGSSEVPKYGFVYQATAKTLPNGTVIPKGLYVDNIMMGELDAKKLNAESLSAITANLGTFTSTNSKGTMTIRGTDISIKDTNGVERIFIGL